MKINHQICERARLARDPRFDGLFFVGVLSTGIYCRPICPAPPAKPENIVYFETAAKAGKAGLRPCLRCRPESSPGSPAWNGTSVTVSRALMLIRRGALNENNLDQLAFKLGIGGRHLRRLFQAHLGVSPKALITSQKVLFAKKLLHETQLPITDIALASGFGSVRRFNAAFKKSCGKTPTSFRQPGAASGKTSRSTFKCTLTLAYRPPFDWQRMLAFFKTRAIPGVEVVKDNIYKRSIRIDGATGFIAVSSSTEKNSLNLDVSLPDSRLLMMVVARVRQLFDLDANMAAIHEVLSTDPLLDEIIGRMPGLRLPGAWNPLEASVRAIVGQQISVKGACTVIGRIVAKAGPAVVNGSHNVDRLDTYSGMTHFFPTADELQRCNLNHIGMPAKRARTLKNLAHAVATQALTLSIGGSLVDFIKKMVALPGIGPWTAQYIAMRALGEPDAFPATDLGIIKALSTNGIRPTKSQVCQRAEKWSPWRAYAAIYLWHG